MYYVPVRNPPGKDIAVSRFVADALKHTDSASFQDALEISNDVVDITHHGAVGNGLSDSRAALVAALAAAGAIDGSVFIPAGNFRIAMLNATGISIPAGVTVFGTGASSVLLFDGGTNTNHVGLLPGDDSTLRNLKIAHIHTTSNTAGNFMPLDSSRVRFENVVFAGPHTSTFVSRVSLIGLADTDTTDLAVVGCEFSGWTFVLLKGNTNTGTQRRLNFHHNYFHDNYDDTLEFNSPLGAIEDVKVIGNLFDTVTPVTSAGIHVGLQSVKRFVVANNIFIGTASRAIQMEENVQRGAITGNVISHAGIGIWLVVNDNRTPATYFHPAHILIDGNYLEDTSPSTYHGIRVSDNDASGLAVLENVSITNNYIRGFDIGIYIDRLVGVPVMRGENISGNRIRACVTAFQGENPHPGIRDNVISSCTTAFNFQNGGLIGRHSFRAITTFATVTNGRLAIDGFTSEVTQNLPATTTTAVALLEGNTANEFSGILKAACQIDGTANWLHKVARPNWDGSAFTENSWNVANNGVVTDSAFAATAGVLSWSLNNTGGSALSARVQASFEGLYTF